MLSAPQTFLIEALPAEGGCYYYQEGKKVDYAPEQAEALSLLPLKHRQAPNEKKAIILHGAPGSGKSFSGLRRLNQHDIDWTKNIAIISYDEAGAIYDIPEYVEKLQAIVPDLGNQHGTLSPEQGLETMAARHQLWLDFQPLSQHIRTLTLKEALRRELSLFVDTTSSSPGAFRMIEMLRDLDYGHIEVWSVHSPLDVAKDRIVQRGRPTSGNDYLAKRAGAYETLPHLCGEADRMVITLNENNQTEPIDIAILEYGQVKHMDQAGVSYLNRRLEAEASKFGYLASQHLPDVKNLDQRYHHATRAFIEHIESYDPNSRSQLAQYYYHQEMSRQP